MLSTTTFIAKRKKEKNTLLRLTTEQADKTSFPEGCPVFYNFWQSSSSSSTSSSSSSCSNDSDAAAAIRNTAASPGNDTVVMNVREGIVKYVSLNTNEKRFQFQIIEKRREDSKADADTTADDGCETTIMLDDAKEDDVAYAIHCPVTVTQPGPDKESIEGKVLFAKPLTNKNGQTIMSYIVQYNFTGEHNEHLNMLRMEEGVTADRISYNLKKHRTKKEDKNVHQARIEEPHIPNSKQIAASLPTLVPFFTSNNSCEGGSRSQKIEAANSFSERTIEEDTRENQNQSSAPHSNTLPRNLGDNYVKKSSEQNTSSPGLLGSAAAVATSSSPLTNGGSCKDGDDRLGIQQHGMIKFQPRDPSRKRRCDVAYLNSKEAAAQQIKFQPPDPSRKRMSDVAYLNSKESAAQQIKFQPPDPSRKRRSDVTLSKSNPSLLVYKQSEEAGEQKQPPNKSNRIERPDLTMLGETKTSLSNNIQCLHSNRKEGACEIGSTSKLGERMTCQLTVPLWVLDSQGGFFLHIVGTGENGKRGYKTINICTETGCRVDISRYNKDARKPMNITITSCHKYRQHGTDTTLVHRDMERAMLMVEECIRDYIETIKKEPGAYGRLRFELRAGSFPSVLLPRSESGAVQIISSDDGSKRWMQLLELPCVPQHGSVFTNSSGGKKRLSHDLQNRIWDDGIQCSAELFADCVDAPLKMCKPYVLVHGRELRQVERAAALITNARV